MVVLGLDGTPHSLLRERLEMRPASLWHRLLAEGRLFRIRSSIPEVSSVAWASYLTGAEPGRHGLFGFVDRAFSPFRLVFPNGADLVRPTLLERVHDAGGAVVSLNVPATFPPKPLRGLVVGGFLGVRLETNVQPPEWAGRLARMGYEIDVDPATAYSDPGRYYDALLRVLDARVRAAMEAADSFDWTLLQLHIMETDRLFHFFWGLEGEAERFHRLLDRVDEAVGRLAELAARRGAAFVVLSDHGFTRARRIVFLNALLRRWGFLRFRPGATPGLEAIAPESRAYALVPGRIFLNLRGREPMGSVPPGPAADALVDEIAARLRDLRDPSDGRVLFRAVHRREEVYHGPEAGRAAELIALPERGVDLKADFAAEEPFSVPRRLVGTHTHDDAFFYQRGGEFPPWEENGADIAAAGRQVGRLLGLPGENGGAVA